MTVKGVDVYAEGSLNDKISKGDELANYGRAQKYDLKCIKKVLLSLIKNDPFP